MPAALTTADAEALRRDVAGALREAADVAADVAAASRDIAARLEGARAALARSSASPWEAAVAGARVASLGALRRAALGLPTSRALLLGDVHAEHVALARALARFGASVDAVLCVGDVVDGDPGRCDAGRAVELLDECGAVAVAGNHDRWWLGGGADLPDATPQDSLGRRAAAWLRSLPRWRWVETASGRAALAHGYLADDMASVSARTGAARAARHPAWAGLRGGGAAYHLSGHSHAPLARRVEAGGFGVTFVNAGTLQRSARRPTVAVVDFARREAFFYRLGADGGTSTAPEEVASL